MVLSIKRDMACGPLQGRMALRGNDKVAYRYSKAVFSLEDSCRYDAPLNWVQPSPKFSNDGNSETTFSSLSFSSADKACGFFILYGINVNSFNYGYNMGAIANLRQNLGQDKLPA
ncbi:hypothetical protein EVAR_101030_1 [Eumeta japonica]|uniref:Uncharacterized protein n=1 Tax=Eumeta variegata TaxID=151549 RepID=A0A4C1SGX6_EUMVA|nr:hypothetical protein EVAR_101030_1 [Eumeta japonica]